MLGKFTDRMQRKTSSFYHMLVLRFSKITQVEITGMELEKGPGISSWRKTMMETARECVEEEQDKQNLEECLLLSDRRNQKPAKFGSLSPFTFVL